MLKYLKDLQQTLLISEDFPFKMPQKQLQNYKQYKMS